MQACNKCKITLRGDKRCCPLCGGSLSGEAENAAYPKIPLRVTKFSIFKFVTFLFVACEIAMFTTLYLTRGNHPWVLFVMIAAPIAWLDLMLAFYFRNNVIKLVTWQVYIGMIINIVIDLKFVHQGWALEWMAPFCFVGLAITTICIGKGLKMLLVEYIIYLAADMVLSLLQLVFIRLGWNRFPMPAIISVSILLTAGVAALLFYSRQLKSAASRMFHV